MMLTEYNEEETMNMFRAEGRAEGVNIITSLYKILLASNRFEDMKRATEDKEYQEKLIAEFSLSV